ncbi:MAG: hypothetical protein AAFR61_18965 [Bacteroidota bacterium]
MSIKYFSELSETEVAQLIKAPAVITALIAGADGEIDQKEEAWGARLVNYRTFTSDVKLHEYYEQVNELFEGHLKGLVAGWNAGSSETLTGEVTALKEVLTKVDGEYADLLKASWRSLAKKIAEADGGFLGFGSIDKAEAALIDLPMLD